MFSLAASWDFPADMSSYDQYGSAGQLRHRRELHQNYQLSPAFLEAHRSPFQTQNRIWIGGYRLYPQDMSDYDSLLTSQGVLHTTIADESGRTPGTSGWMPLRVAGFYQDSLSLPPGPEGPPRRPPPAQEGLTAYADPYAISFSPPPQGGRRTTRAGG